MGEGHFTWPQRRLGSCIGAAGQSEGTVVSVHQLDVMIGGFHITGTVTRVWDPEAARRIRESIVRMQADQVEKWLIAALKGGDCHG